MCTLQAFVVAGGNIEHFMHTSSVLILFSGATDWAPIASLPQPLNGVKASLVGGRIRVNGGHGGGWDGQQYRSEVMTEK